MEIILLTGLSGSGKSVALGALEDAGYYRVDNLPVALLPQLADVLSEARHARVAFSMDVRSSGSVSALPGYLQSLQTGGRTLKIVYLEAKADTLIKRFSETRRRHPLADGNMTLPECIERERELLQELSGISHHIDTSDLNPGALRGWVRDFVAGESQGPILLFQSFAFKHGVPLDADLVFDVRCLPNPHYDPVLRPHTGRDTPVITFLAGEPLVTRMIGDIRRFVAEWLPSFRRDSRSYLTVSIGCTGGRHRSVYIVEQLAAAFSGNQSVLVRHRELDDGRDSRPREPVGIPAP